MTGTLHSHILSNVFGGAVIDCQNGKCQGGNYKELNLGNHPSFFCECACRKLMDRVAAECMSPSMKVILTVSRVFSLLSSHEWPS